jgi:hypothetical protein
MRAGGGRAGGVMGAEGMPDNAAARVFSGVHALFGIDEKALVTDRASDGRGEL